MRSFFLTRYLGVAGLALFSGAALADQPSPARSSVSANVGPLRNTNGTLACRLHKSAEGFPTTAENTSSRRLKVTGTMTRCRFDDLPPGIYAIVVHHDENDNRKFDKNFLGIPLEGYGVSNNHTHAMRPPAWAESKFVLEPEKQLELTIAVRY